MIDHSITAALRLAQSNKNWSGPAVITQASLNGCFASCRDPKVASGHPSWVKLCAAGEALTSREGFGGSTRLLKCLSAIHIPADFRKSELSFPDSTYSPMTWRCHSHAGVPHPSVSLAASSSLNMPQHHAVSRRGLDSPASADRSALTTDIFKRLPVRKKNIPLLVGQRVEHVCLGLGEWLATRWWGAIYNLQRKITVWRRSVGDRRSMEHLTRRGWTISLTPLLPFLRLPFPTCFFISNHARSHSRSPQWLLAMQYFFPPPRTAGAGAIITTITTCWSSSLFVEKYENLRQRPFTA